MTPEEKRAKQRENARLWRKANPEKAKASKQRYRTSVKGKETERRHYEQNKEKLREKVRLWSRKFRAERPDKARANERRWREANPEKAKAIRRAVLRKWREQHPEKSREAARRQRRANPNAKRAAEKKWRQANPHKLAAKFARRRAVARGANGRCTAEQIAERAKVYGEVCAYCGGKYETIDHVIPLARGGSNWPANLRPACKRCNSSKGDKLLSEWRYRKHFTRKEDT
jgi:5-methylcytosine-specific restriction endonuclease McrA